MAVSDKEERTNRRGCFLIAGAIALVLVILAGFALGLFGDEGGKITDLPIPGAGSSSGSGTTG